MKKYGPIVGILLVAVAAVLLAVLVGQGGNKAGADGTVLAGSAAEPRVVTSTGNAEVKVAPDQVVITLGVAMQDPALASAKSQNDVVVRRVLEIAQDYGVKDDHIQTEYLNINPAYDYTSVGRQVLRGYEVDQTIVITLGDLSKFEDLISELLKAGVNYVHDVEFQTTELRKYRDQARALAIQAAKEKSEALAGELDQDLGQPVTIVEEQNTWRSWYGYGWGSRYDSGAAQNVVVEAEPGSLDSGATVAPGQITVSATVTVTFALR
jgi:uncharacterized protein YggE